MDDAYEEVYFHEYCKKCKHEKNAENEEPCFECLNEPENLHSHKPVNWEAKENNWRVPRRIPDSKTLSKNKKHTAADSCADYENTSKPLPPAPL